MLKLIYSIYVKYQWTYFWFLCQELGTAATKFAGQKNWLIIALWLHLLLLLHLDTESLTLSVFLLVTEVLQRCRYR